MAVFLAMPSEMKTEAAASRERLGVQAKERSTMMAGRLGPRKAISSKPVLRDGNRVYLGTAERCLPDLARQRDGC